MKNNELAILDISGSWINNRGSILKLNQVDSSQIHGTYTTAVAKTIGCIGYPAPVSGFINGYGIALSISMRGCKSPVVITKTGSCILKDNLIEQINKWNNK